MFGAQAIVAADETIVTVLPGYHELRALNRVLEGIDRQADEHGTALGLLGVLFVNAEGRWRTTKEYAEHLDAEEVGMFATIVPRHQPVTDHARFGLPTFLLKRRNKVTAAYREVADEIVTRLSGRPVAA